MEHHGHGPNDHLEHHVIPLNVYLGIFGALIFLTAATVGVSYLPVSPTEHLLGAIVIASVKTVLIVLYFMHVRYNSHLIWSFAVLGFFFVAIFMVFMMGDYISQFLSLSPSTYAEPFGMF
jgi:cytochrome c oxidase subunit 4